MKEAAATSTFFFFSSPYCGLWKCGGVLRVDQNAGRDGKGSCYMGGLSCHETKLRLDEYHLSHLCHETELRPE